jgi:hypothetical protein
VKNGSKIGTARRTQNTVSVVIAVACPELESNTAVNGSSTRVRPSHPADRRRLTRDRLVHALAARTMMEIWNRDAQK